MENRYLKFSEVTTRSDEDGTPILEGYFVRYDDIYKIADGATESIARGAFKDSINGDVRALYNHNQDIILGRTSANTLELRDTDVGLWGKILINPKDTQAMDAYERVKRGDITGCSFGFDIAPNGEETRINEDGSVHWTITKVNPLYEISPCVFPAYEATSVTARMHDLEEIHKRTREAWKEKTLKKLKGEKPC